MIVSTAKNKKDEYFTEYWFNTKSPKPAMENTIRVSSNKAFPGSSHPELIDNMASAITKANMLVPTVPVNRTLRSLPFRAVSGFTDSNLLILTHNNLIVFIMRSPCHSGVAKILAHPIQYEV
jgi:hypothetical protein